MLLHIEVSPPQAVTVPLINYCMLSDALTMERCVFLNMPAQSGVCLRSHWYFEYQTGSSGKDKSQVKLVKDSLNMDML